MNRIVVGSVAGLLLGAAGASFAAGARPEPADISRWCSTEQQGAIALAEQLHRRELEITRLEQAQAARSQDLVAAEARLAARMTELGALRAELDAKLVQADAEREARLRAVVQMVEANRANAVAPMFQELDPALAVEVLDHMKRSKAGKLLAALPAPQAAALAARMTDPIELSRR